MFAQPTSSTMPAMIVNRPMNAKQRQRFRHPAEPRDAVDPEHLGLSETLSKLRIFAGELQGDDPRRCLRLRRVDAGGPGLAAIWNATLPRSRIMLPIFGRSIGIQKSEKKPAGRARHGTLAASRRAPRTDDR